MIDVLALTEYQEKFTTWQNQLNTSFNNIKYLINRLQSGNISKDSFILFLKDEKKFQRTTIMKISKLVRDIEISSLSD